MTAIPAVRKWTQLPRDTLPLALWDSAAIEQATGGSASAPFTASGVEMDSRDVRPGDLFVALSGESTDGHRFVEQAFSKGAAAALVERPVPFPHVLVTHTMSALRALAAGGAGPHRRPHHRRHRLGWQDRGQGSYLRRGRTHEPGGSASLHPQLQQPCRRTAQFGENAGA